MHPPLSGLVDIVRHRPMRSAAAHASRHEHLSLAYCLSGEWHFEQGTAWTLHAGDVLLIPAGMAHRAEGAEEGTTTIGMRVCATCLVHADRADALEPFERVRRGGAAVVQLPSDRRAFFESLLAEIDAENARPAPDPRRLVDLIALSLTEVSRASSSAFAGSGNLVADTLAFIERRCLDSIGLREVAEAMQRSPAHLTTQIRKATGKTVQAWIVSGRLAEAERRLLHTDERVDIVAERVGYKDVTHFIRMFRRERGVTPAAFRRAAR